MDRPDWLDVWGSLALTMAKRSKCDRAQIGCVIVSKENRVVATGYNGPPAKWRNGFAPSGGCTNWCPRAQGDQLFSDYSDCPSNHAEINALMHSSRSDREGGTIYVTGVTCYACAKAIANSGITMVVLVNVARSADGHRNPEQSAKLLGQSDVLVCYHDVRDA